MRQDLGGISGSHPAAIPLLMSKMVVKSSVSSGQVSCCTRVHLTRLVSFQRFAAYFSGFPSQDYMIARNAEQTEVANKKTSTASTFRPFRSTETILRFWHRLCGVQCIDVNLILLLLRYLEMYILFFLLIISRKVYYVNIINISHVSSGWSLRHAASMQFGGSESEGEGDSHYGLIQRSLAWTHGCWEQLFLIFHVGVLLPTHLYRFSMFFFGGGEEIPVTIVDCLKALCNFFLYISSYIFKLCLFCVACQTSGGPPAKVCLHNLSTQGQILPTRPGSLKHLQSCKPKERFTGLGEVYVVTQDRL